MHAVRRTLYGADRELRVLIVGLGGGVLPLYLLDVTIHYAQCGSPPVVSVALSSVPRALHIASLQSTTECFAHCRLHCGASAALVCIAQRKVDCDSGA